MPRVITLTVSDEAFELVRTGMALRLMADASHGPSDEAMRKIIAALDRGDAECTISTRREREAALAKTNPKVGDPEPSPTPLSGEST